MAVFTTLDSHDIDAFLSGYDLGKLQRFEGILSGVENTNYHIHTDTGRYVLTVHEGKVAESDLPYFLGLIQHLSAAAIPTCGIIPRNDGALYGHLKGKTAAISVYLDGQGTAPDDITDAQCSAAGEMLAKMHEAGDGFSIRRPNKMGLSKWQSLWGENEDKADSVVEGQAALVNDVFSDLIDVWPMLVTKDLPKGAVHCDFFPDNVFFKDGQLSGIIDFYYACDEYFIYDLALTINAWCFNAAAEGIPARFDAMMQGYQTVRPLNDDERGIFGLMLQASALRIQMTRLHDYLNHPGDDVVIPHDPKAFLERIKHWRANSPCA
ncbi:MAG: homoserine kinase [Alphaproteobacteria bacterium]|nr:homoserine kinase [Alphaproteobacteria bacterium]